MPPLKREQFGPAGRIRRPAEYADTDMRRPPWAAPITRRAFSAGLVFLALSGAAAGHGLRLAVTELDLVEALLTLGIAPVATVEVERYRHLFRDTPLPEDCIDLGAAWEPNLELLQSVAPDLIFVSSGRSLLEPMLKRVAPTEFIDPPATRDRYRRGLSVLSLLAERLSVQERAEAAIPRFDAILADAQETAASSGLAGRPVYLVTLVDDAVHLEIYGRGCLLHDVMTLLGLRNAWKGAMPGYGWVVAGLETVASSPEAALVYLDHGERTRRTLARLQQSSLWQALPQVRHGRVHAVTAASVWGGAATAVHFANRLARSLAVAG